MPHEIRVPRLGWSMEEGTFVGWLKKPGEHVVAGEALFELEGEKALQDIESVDEGILHLPPGSPQPGIVVAVGSLLGYLLAPGEPAPSAQPDQDAAPSGQTPSLAEAATIAASPPPAGPAVRRQARELGIDLSRISGSGGSGRITQADVLAHAGSRNEPIAPPNHPADRPRHPAAALPVATPRARRVAAELGIDWTGLSGTGRDGRIRDADVRAAADRNSSSASKTHAGRTKMTATPLSTRRQTIARRLWASYEQTVPVTLTTAADATNLVALREQFRSASAESVPSYTDVVARLAGVVLTKHPQVAVRWGDDHRSLLSPADHQFDIGIAVDTSDGLLVPVVRDVIHKSLLDVAREAAMLIGRARSGNLTVAEMQGALFTITNLGALGVDAFTPVINAPEIAILGLGAIRREPVVMPDDRILPRDRMTLSLTFDHAAVDGAPAAAFLRDICSAIENPAAHLLGG